MKSEHGGNVYQIARRMNCRHDQLLDFSANINPLGFSPRIKHVLAEADKAILHYPDLESYDLIDELARFHNLGPANFLAGNGSTEFIFLLPRLLKPRSVLIVTPTFTEYEAGIKFTKGVVFYYQTLEEENFCIQEKKLLAELQRGYDLLFLCNPNNPTGVLTPLTMLQEVIHYASIKGVKVIVDETFIDFNEDHSLKQETQHFENLYILRSMTKFFAIPGLRAGYLIAHGKNITKIREIREPWTINALAQLASIASLRDKAFIKKTLHYVTEARKEFFSELKKIPLLKVFKGKGNYLFLKLHDTAPLSVSDLYEQLLQKGIIIRKCDNFQGLADNFFRLAVRKKNENKRLVAELRKLLHA